MERVLVIGSCGAGKSTFSRKLRMVTDLELIHLDQYYWRPNWEETDSKEWNNVVAELIAKPAWIIDGNYGGTMDTRIERADTIIYLDFSTAKCLWRVTKRVLKYWGRERPDMPPGCRERFDLEFYHYVATFNLLRRKKLLKKMKNLDRQKQVLIFRSDQEADEYLRRLRIERNSGSKP